MEELLASKSSSSKIFASRERPEKIPEKSSKRRRHRHSSSSSENSTTPERTRYRSKSREKSEQQDTSQTSVPAQVTEMDIYLHLKKPQDMVEPAKSEFPEQDIYHHLRNK